MLDTNVKKQAARVGKSLLADEAFVVLKKFSILLLQEAPEQNKHFGLYEKYQKRTINQTINWNIVFFLKTTELQRGKVHLK